MTPRDTIIARIEQRLAEGWDASCFYADECRAILADMRKAEALEAENLRLMQLLTDGPATPKECAEFCRTARDDGDGKPCLDCDPERFCIA